MIIYESSTPNDYSLKELILSDYLRYKHVPEFEGEVPEQTLRTSPIITHKFLLIMVAKALLAKDQCFTYSFWMRLVSRPNPLRRIALWKFRRLCRLYGTQIMNGDKIGPGLYIGHGIGTIINRDVVMGQNCTVSQLITLGTNYNRPATLGDFVYIGPLVASIEDVHIGNHAKVGAGCVVTKDVPDWATAIGVPNRNIMPKEVEE
jgi:serine O-acetyltransferase